MKEDNLLNMAAGLSDLWDRGEYTRARVKDGVYNLFGKRVALNLVIQPVVAEAFFSNKILRGQGLMSRRLISWPTSNIGNRPYKKEDLLQDKGMQAFFQRMYAMLDGLLADGLKLPDECA